MKKLLFVAMATLALMTTACGGNKSQKEGDAEGEQAKKEMAWQTYTNDNYGYSIEVPGDMTKRETMIEENGTIFSLDGDEGVTLNRIDITGGKDMFDEEYTPERIKAYYEDDIANKDVTSSECGDNYYTFSILGGEYCDQINYNIYNGSRYVTVVVCYEPGFEDKLGGDVAKRVFESIKFK
ncbi:MAG: hypothetical protein K6B13_06505 [Prevotella sp.]|nr:hypothetical protein [Prevotella sp.]